MKISLLELTRVDTLRHRDTARDIVELVSADDSDVVIDFSGVVFASRSFCHELLKGLGDRGVEFVNMSKGVEDMFGLCRHKPTVEFNSRMRTEKLELPPG